MLQNIWHVDLCVGTNPKAVPIYIHIYAVLILENCDRVTSPTVVDLNKGHLNDLDSLLKTSPEVKYKRTQAIRHQI